MRWFGGDLELGADYWRFLFAEGFFDFGMFVFFFLYNLYLLQLGFDEKFLGLMSGIMTAGNVAGSILAVFALRRFGIQRTLMAIFRTHGWTFGCSRSGDFGTGSAGPGRRSGA